MGRKTFLIVLLLFPVIFPGGRDVNERPFRPSDLIPGSRTMIHPPEENYNPPPLQYFGTEPIEDLDYLA